MERDWVEWSVCYDSLALKVFREKKGERWIYQLKFKGGWMRWA